MDKNILYIFTVMFLLSEDSSAQDINTQNFFRFTDTNDEYGKICEEHEYITAMQRLDLISNKEALFGDILRDSHSITSVNPNIVIDTNLTKCNVGDKDTSSYTYKENLSYINDNIVSIKIHQHEYGAGAAHGNSDISHYIYDREYGMGVKWEDLFGSDKSLDLHILKRVIEEIADLEFIEYFNAKEQLLNFRVPGYFAISEEGLFIQYGKYEIASGAAGLPSIIIPKNTLKKFMTKEIYNKCFTTRVKLVATAI